MRGWKVVIGGSALSKGAGNDGARTRHRRVRRLWHVGDLPGPNAGPSATRLASRKMSTENAVIRCKAGRAIPLVELQIVDPDGERTAVRWQIRRRNRRARAMADTELLQEPERLGRTLVRWLSAHRGYWHDRRTWLGADHGSRQGRDQDRRRMGLLAGDRGYALAAPCGERGRCRRHSRSAMGRTPVRACRAQSGACGRRDAAAAPRACGALRREGSDLEIRSARHDPS